jgi:prepilin-type processing-associated H-X9-DG protein
MSDDPYESPHSTGGAPTQKDGSVARRIAIAFAVFGVLVILVCMGLPAFRGGAGEAARRMHCSNNLKQIAIALHNYESVYHCLPPACTVDANGKPLHSWRTLILPFMEQMTLYETIDLSKPWDDPANKGARETRVPAYQCPSTKCPPNHTNYLAIVTPESCIQPTKPRKLSEITDGTGSTLMVVDVDARHSVPWMSPLDVNEQWLLNLGNVDKLPHPGGINVTFADGHIAFVSSKTNPTTFHAMITAAGNDSAGFPDSN